MDKEHSPNSSIFSTFEGDDTTKKAVVFAIASIITTILILMLLQIYAKIFWWRYGQHFNPNLNQTDPGSTVIGRQRRRFVFAQAQDPPRNIGLDSSILKSIPIIVFNSNDFKDGLECAVCLSDVINGDKARVLPYCNHGFHVDCIDMWFQSHSTCPLCRNTIGVVEGDNLSQNQNFESGQLSNHHQNQSQDSNPPDFPTNVLVWGDHSQVRSTGLVVIEDLESGNLPDSSNNHQQETESEAMAISVVEIPVNQSDNLSDEDPKSPMITRLKSLKRFLSREKKAVACSSSNSNV